MTSTKNIALVGLGKMGISHLAIANATPGLRVSAVCDSSKLVGHMVEKYCGIPYVASYDKLIEQPDLDAVIIATPTRLHDTMIRAALAKGLHIFCEKPLTLSSAASRELAGQARASGVVCQVGYHNRYVATFGEAKRLLDLGVIGRIRHIHAEAYGPVVLKPVSATWRSRPDEGGGCLYDYAAHPINLMNWYAGRAVSCHGAQMTRQFSTAVDDAVYAGLTLQDGVSGQVSVNWSDETIRKMTTVITVWADGGKMVTDRQELKVYISGRGTPIDGYGEGWTIKYITDLTPGVDFYLRGEEYSAQLAGFRAAMDDPGGAYANDFDGAADTDLTLELIRATAKLPPHAPEGFVAPEPIPARRRGVLDRVLGRRDG